MPNLLDTLSRSASRAGAAVADAARRTASAASNAARKTTSAVATGARSVASAASGAAERILPGPLPEANVPAKADPPKAAPGTAAKPVRVSKPKKILRSVATAAAAVAVVLSLATPQEAETPTVQTVADRPAVVCVADDAMNDGDAALEDEEKRRSPRASRRSVLLSRLKTVLMGAVSLLGTVLLKVVSLFFTSLLAKVVGAPVTTLLGFLGDVLVTFVILMLVFGLLFHKLYPDRKLKEFYTKKNILIMLAASVVLGLVKLFLARYSETAYVVYVLLQSACTLAVYLAVWFFLFTGKGLARASARRVLRSRAGRVLFCCLTGFTALSAVFRIVAFRSGTGAAILECVALFLVCIAVAFFGSRIAHWVKNPDLQPLRRAA